MRRGERLAQVSSPDAQDFGTLLKRLRGEADLSQEGLAELAGVSVQAVGAYERGARRAPHRDTLAMLANALRVSDDTRRQMERLADRRRGPRGTRGAVPSNTAPPHNLPEYRTPFIGRARDVADLLDLVRANRFVTLFGFGGIGKTRLALEVGAQCLVSYPDGVWFVPFAPLDDPELIVDAIGAALGIRSESHASLKTALSSRRMLLIFDNCEHLAAPIAAVAARLIAECPTLTLLATSRQPLGIDGEALFRLDGLAASESVQLFVQRAQSVERRFVSSDENAAAVSAICSRLEGIPLAIELAAARVNVLHVDDLSRRLRDGFRLLKRTSTDGTARHHTLRATIDWSFGLLSANEKQLLERLAIFAGGWRLEAAEFVCGGDSAAGDVLEDLSSLVNKSLVTFDMTATPRRYAFLAATREYALEKLNDGGRMNEVAARRAAWFASFADDLFQAFQRMTQPQWLAQVLPEIENLRAALQWALSAQGDLEIAARIAGSLSPLWQARGIGEGRRYLEAILERLPGDTSEKTEALLWLSLAGITVAKGKVDAAERAERLYDRLGDRAGQAESLRYRAEGLRQMQRLDEAAEALDRAARLFCDLGLVEGPSYSDLLQTRALILANTGRYSEAVSVFDEAMRRFEAVGDEEAIAGAKCQLADVEFWRGNVERALALGNEGIEICERLGDTVKEAAMTINVAAYHLVAGEIEIARDAARDALELASSLGISFYVTLALQHLGSVAALRGDANRGLALLAYSDRWLKNEGFEREITERRSYELGLEALQRAGMLPATMPAISEAEALAQSRHV